MQGTAGQVALDRRLLREGYWFDADEADRICQFFALLVHSKGEFAGQPFTLERWQRSHLRRLFGWRRANGTRRYRRSHWWVPKKNGKSTLAAGVALYLLLADGEPGAEVYSAAGSREQAEIVFREAANMVEASPVLDQLAEVFNASIYVASTLSSYRVVASKAATAHGINTHGLVIDEIHAFPHRELYDVLAAGVAARRQPLEFVISTAGDDIGGIGYELFEYSRQCLADVLEDPEFLPVVYAATDDDDWEAESTWRRANPNYGVSVNAETLRGLALKARGMPAAVAAFKQLHLNVWTQSQKAWLDLGRWRKCAGAPTDLDAYRGRRCYAGLDLSSTTDLTALALVFPREADGFDVWTRHWCPEEGIELRARRDRVSYPAWRDAGCLIATPGNVVDYARVRADIVAIAKDLKLVELGYDPWRAAQLATQLQDEDGLQLVEVRQGYRSLAAPTAELERLILSRRLHHTGCPLLTWQASNVVVRRDPAGNIKPDKERSRERIDGIVALITALARATLATDTTPVYETRGIVTL